MIMNRGEGLFWKSWIHFVRINYGITKAVTIRSLLNVTVEINVQFVSPL